MSKLDHTKVSTQNNSGSSTASRTITDLKSGSLLLVDRADDSDVGSCSVSSGDIVLAVYGSVSTNTWGLIILTTSTSVTVRIDGGTKFDFYN